MIVFGYWPNFEAEYVIFLILNLNFRGVPSLFQGIVHMSGTGVSEISEK